MIVDLTFTTKYYNPKYFVDQDIEYQKVFVPGKQVPNSKCVEQFFKVVDKFLEENEENEKLIGVHCTHGLNRTGYMICRYMIEVS